MARFRTLLVCGTSVIFLYSELMTVKGHPPTSFDEFRRERFTTNANRNEFDTVGDIEYTSCHWYPPPAGSRSKQPLMNCEGEEWVVGKCSYDRCECCKNRDSSVPGKAYCNLPRFGLSSVPSLPDYVHMLYLVAMALTSENVTSQLFENVPDMTHLFLAGNRITSLERGAFAGLRHLVCLSLDGNPSLQEEAVLQALQIPGLQMLSTSVLKLTPPPAAAVQGINSTVRLWDFSSNSPAYTYNITAFSALPLLQTLKLSFCYFRQIVSVGPFLRLTYLDLGFNTLYDFPKTCTNGRQSLFPQLKVLLLKSTLLVIMHARNICLPKLTYLDLTGNGLAVFQPGTFNNTFFPRLERLHLDFPIVDLLNARFSSFLTFRNYTFQISTLRELSLIGYDMQFGSRRAVESQAFSGCVNLEVINLSKNNFRHVDDDRMFELFGDLRALKSISIVDSDVEAVFRTLKLFTNLTKLDLSGNLITTIPDGVFDALEFLTHLDLSDNKISSISEQTFGMNVRSELKYLGLGQNAFVCTCQLMWFRNWFKSNHSLFVKNPSETPLLEYHCSNLDGLPLYNFSLVDQACLLGRGTSIQIIVSCFILILSLTVVSLVFRYRWHVRLVLYEAFRGHGDARRLRLLNSVFDFDVFLSYASENEPWVRQHLVPEMEERLGLRMCMHERDFIPGKNILDNIVDCVIRSKKIIMVFSKDFVSSQWCQFELTFCLSHVMDYDDALIVVCVDDVASRDMTSAMMAVLKTTTYIQWADQSDAVQSFWARVRMSLQEIMEDNGSNQAS